MPNASIGGMISGLDTATIINQLMQLEARSQTQLKTRVSTQQRQITSLQTVNAKLAALVTKAGDLTKADAWSPTTATSSNDKVTVTASGTATPASLSLTVGKVATSSVLDFGTHALTDKVNADSSPLVTFTKPDGTTVDLDTKDGTVKGLVDAINGGNVGANATLVQVSAGVYRLQVTATATGPKDIGLAAQNGSAMSIGGTLTKGQQAEITIGTDLVTSDSNTFSGLMPGVDVTLQPGATGDAVVTVARDVKGMNASVKALVEAVNAALDDISSLTAYGVGGRSAGILAGDSTLRGVRDQLLSAITGGVNSQSMASHGIQVDRYGKLVFDEAVFEKAYAADPTAATTAFTSSKVTGAAYDGLAVVLKQVANTASNSTTGTVTSAIKGRTASIDDLNDAIDAWDVRLETKRLALQRQYAALEVALGNLQNQSSWLAGQIAGLPTMSSGS